MSNPARLLRALAAHVLLLLPLVTPGCASFAGHALPEVRLEDVEKGGRLPAITYDLTEASAGTVASSSLPSYSLTRVEPLFRRMFVDSKRQGEPGPLHLDMYFRQRARNPTVTLGLALVFIASLGLIPAYGEDELYLEVKVRRGGECVRQYLYTDEVRTWMHWFMLPWAFSKDPEEVSARVFDNMLLNLVRDLQRDLPQLAPGA